LTPVAVFALGLGVLIFLILLGRGYVSADARTLARLLRKIGGLVFAIAAVALAATGRFAVAVGAAGLAWALLFGSDAPWQKARGAFGGGGERPRGPSGPRMTRAEALQVLGLGEGAGEEDIRAAHRRLIRQTHPDAGGTNYLAAKINEAKDVLLG
jgi:hypothetical protein